MIIRLAIVAALIEFVVGHIGQKCNLLNLCLPWTGYMQCNSEKICECRPEFPIQIDHHTCVRPKKVGERCKYNEECTYNDNKTYCTQSSVSSQCVCNYGYRLDLVSSKCVEVSPASRGLLFLPSAAGFLLAMFALLCCGIFVWHQFCRVWRPRNRPPLSNRNSADMIRVPMSTALRRNSSDIPSRLNSSSLEPSLYDQPPPSYDDAIKGDYLQIPPPSYENENKPST